MTGALLATAWLVGLALGSLVTVLWAPLLLFTAAALLLALVLRRVAVPWRLALLPLLVLFGVARTLPLPWQEPLPLVATYNDAGQVRLSAEVLEDPQDTVRSLRVPVEALWVETPQGRQAKRGRVLVFLPPIGADETTSPLRPGDQVVMEGALETPPVLEEFDYPAYLASQGVGSVMYNPRVEVLSTSTWSLQRALSPLRHRLARSLKEALPEPEGALARTLVLGLGRDLAPPLTKAFQATGTTHLLAISGLQVVLVMGLLLSAGEALLGRRRQLYLLLPFLGVWLYALLAGTSPSVSRAAVMATLYLVALGLGRQSSLLTALALTAAVMAGLDPSVLGSISFQLSFTAVAGIAFLYPWMRDVGRSAIERLRTPGWTLAVLVLVADAIAVSLAATLATLPLLVFHFDRFSWLSIPLTVALLPAQSPILLLSFLTAIVGLVSPVVSQGIGWLDWVFLRYMVALVRPFEEIPWSSLSLGSFSLPIVGLYYGGLLAVAWRLSGGRLFGRRATPGPRLSAELPWMPASPALYLALLFLLASVFVWGAVIADLGRDGRLHVTVLDVGQGDAILVESPEGHRVLIDGGPDPRLLLDHLSTRLPLSARRLDVVVLTHPDADHLDGLLGLPGKYPVGAVLDPESPTDSPNYARWRQLLQDKGIRLFTARAGMEVRLGELTMDVLNPSEPLLEGTRRDGNNNGVVVRVRYRRATILLTADIEEEAEAYLIRHVPDLGSTVLKVAHHGSATSSTEAFLAATAPSVAVISVGVDNHFGHPNPQVLARLKERVAYVLQTSRRGTVELVTDGMTLWVKPQR